MNRYFPRLGLAALAIVAGSGVAYSQTVTTGAVNGMVADNTGSPLAGATVRLSSGQITRSVTTGADGRFSAGLLNAGPWQVSVTKSGYTGHPQTVNVGINAATSISFKLAKEGSATVEVVANASSIDASSTTTGSNFAMESISAIPKGRDISDVAFLAPGVTTSGFDSQGLNISINGASGAENSYSIDGLTTNDMRYGGRGVSLVNEFVDQVDVQTGGFKPEFSALGGVFNALTKTGSNQFAGSTWFTATPNSTQPGPKQNKFTKQDEASSVYDLGVWVGGALVKDRFFYSLGVNYNRKTEPNGLNKSGHPFAEARTNTTQYFGKFNLYLTPDHQLTLSTFGTPAKTSQGSSNTLRSIGDGRGTSQQGFDSTRDTSNFSLIYDGVLSPTMTLSAKLGQFKIKTDTTPLDMARPLINDTLWYSPLGPEPNSDLDAIIYSRGGYGLVTNEKNATTQASLDFSWILGDHALKAGYSSMNSSYDLTERYSGGRRFSIDTRHGLPRLRERVITNDSTVKAEFSAFYMQDTWQATKALNVFFGARAEKQVQKDANDRTFLTFNMGKYIQPRVGFTWDVLENGKSKLSGSYGRYYEKIPQRMAIREFSKESFIEYRYGGDYAGTNFTYNPNAANMVGTYGGTPYVVDYGASFQFPPVQDGVKLPQRDEFQIGYQQNVSDTVTLGVDARYRKLKNPLEDSVITDASGNVLNTSDNGGSDKAIIWNPGSRVSFTDNGIKFSTDNSLYPEAYNKYTAVDFTFERKTANTYLSLSYTWSKLEGNYEGLISSSNGQADANITASWDYFPYVGTGLLPLDRTHQFKAYGYQKFTLAGNPLSAGFNFVWQSGVPISYFDDGSSSTPPIPDLGQYGDSTPKNGKLGDQGRTPSTAKLDLNLEYDISLGGKLHLQPMINVFNVFNARPTTTVQEQATDSGGVAFPAGKYGSAKTWNEGRSFRFGARLRF